MRFVSVAAVSTLLLGGVAGAQAPASSTVVGFMHAIHATNDVEKTLAFYTDVFGIADPAQPAMWDPGAPHMKFLVRDIEPVVAALRKLGATIITKSGAPVSVTTSLGSVKAIFFRDPDGYIVEAIEMRAPAHAPAGNLIGSIMGETVGDLDASMKFWHGTLGLEVSGDQKFSTDAAMLDLMGIPKGGSFRTVAAVMPGSKARIEFTEFKGMPRKEFSLRVPDPGASGMAIRVARIANLLAKLKADGIRVISRDGELVV